MAISSIRHGVRGVDAELVDAQLVVHALVRREADDPLAAGRHDAAAVAQPLATRRRQTPAAEQPPQIARRQAGRIGTDHAHLDGGHLWGRGLLGKQTARTLGEQRRCQTRTVNESTRLRQFSPGSSAGSPAFRHVQAGIRRELSSARTTSGTTGAD